MKFKTLFVVIFIGLLIAPHIYQQFKFKRELKNRIDNSQTRLERNKNYNVDQTGYVKGVGFNCLLTEKIIHDKLKKSSLKRQSYFSAWKWRNKVEVTASAQGLDKLHHFVNSYLVGFQPFDTDKLWVPLYTLAIKKKYQYDHLQYSGLADVWQNSLQAFYYSRGDCEDHSIALADWLISLGKDARVVLGDCNGNGHAWVVLLHDRKEYILEATNKRRIQSLKHYPLSGLAKGYHPTFQFNRTDFWVNTGSKFTTKYTGKQWVLRSHFIKSRRKGARPSV